MKHDLVANVFALDLIVFGVFFGKKWTKPEHTRQRNDAVDELHSLPVIFEQTHKRVGECVEYEKAKRKAERHSHRGRYVIFRVGRIVQTRHDTAQHEHDTRPDAERNRVGKKQIVFVRHKARHQQRAETHHETT